MIFFFFFTSINEITRMHLLRIVHLCNVINNIIKLTYQQAI
jgi:hypothetical protein